MLIKQYGLLKGNYHRYQSRAVKKLCNQIPKERKENLLNEIKARATISGLNNPSALRSAIKHLKTKEPNGEKKTQDPKANV